MRSNHDDGAQKHWVGGASCKGGLVNERIEAIELDKEEIDVASESRWRKKGRIGKLADGLEKDEKSVVRDGIEMIGNSAGNIGLKGCKVGEIFEGVGGFDFAAGQEDTVRAHATSEAGGVGCSAGWRYTVVRAMYVSKKASEAVGAAWRERGSLRVRTACVAASSGSSADTAAKVGAAKGIDAVKEPAKVSGVVDNGWRKREYVLIGGWKGGGRPGNGRYGGRGFKVSQWHGGIWTCGVT